MLPIRIPKNTKNAKPALPFDLTAVSVRSPLAMSALQLDDERRSTAKQNELQTLVPEHSPKSPLYRG